jgi:hypothetical protein
VPFVPACFHASAAPRLENSDSDEKDALVGLDNYTIFILEAIIMLKQCFT